MYSPYYQAYAVTKSVTGNCIEITRYLFHIELIAALYAFFAQKIGRFAFSANKIIDREKTATQ